MITTERLRLRPWTDADIEPFARNNADPRVMEFFPSPMTHSQTAYTVRRWQKHFARYGFCFFAAERLDNNEFIGVIGPSWHSYTSPFAPAIEIGWRLDPDAWGYGYATEGAIGSAAFIFDQGHSEIVALTVPDNAPSRAVMERVGMTRDSADDFLHPVGGQLHVLYRLGRAAFSDKFGGMNLYALEP
jgi:RimJ/RimL family protein N-acetyltransferase